MNKKEENKKFNDIRKQLSNILLNYNFKQTKQSYFIKLYDDRIEFIYLSKFDHGPYLRIHMGIRFYIDEFETIIFNGPESRLIRYFITDISMKKCMNEILSFIKYTGIKWLNKWKNLKKLLTKNDSPLNKDLKLKYLNWIKKKIKNKNYYHSCKLLGIK